MAGENLIIEVGSDMVRATVVKPGSTEIEARLGMAMVEVPAVDDTDLSAEAKAKDAAEYEEASDDSLTSTLKAIVSELRGLGYGDYSLVMASMPEDFVSMRILDLPVHDKKKAEEILPYELSDHIPWQASDVEFSAMMLGGDRTLAVSVLKSSLSSFIESFKGASIEPNWIGVSVLQKHRLLKGLLNGDGDASAIFVDEHSVTAVSGGNPYFFMRYGDETGLKLALAACEAELGEIKLIYATSFAKGTLESIGRESIESASVADDDSGAVSIAMEAQVGLKGSVNFRKGSFANRRVSGPVAKRLKVLIVLIIASAVMWGVFMGVKVRNLNLKGKALDKSLALSYAEVFPGKSPGIDALYRLEVKVKESSDRSVLSKTTVDVLDVLNKLGTFKSKGNVVEFHKVVIKNGKVTALCETSSITSVNEWKAALAEAGLFGDVAHSDIEKLSSGRVSFKLTFKVKG